MTRRERVYRAMRYQSVDQVPLQYYYTPVGYYEHGEKLNDLFSAHPGDFEPFARQEIPVPPKEDFDSSGRYFATRADEWGVIWAYRIFGIAGLPHIRPIHSPEDMADYRLPPAASLAGPEYDAYARFVKERQESDYFTFGNCGSIHERLLALYGDENVLCDIMEGAPEIADLADRITEYDLALAKRAVQAGVDAITMGDDFGTEKGMIMSPALWRQFYKPRFRRIFEPARRAGIPIHFHSCGKIWPILEDLREIGVTSIWPQLPAYPMEELAAHCRALGLAVAIHTDRARTMTYGTPKDVKELVCREFDAFRMMDGGSWFYVEADNGFPYENIEALVETIASLSGR